MHSTEGIKHLPPHRHCSHCEWKGFKDCALQMAVWCPTLWAATPTPPSSWLGRRRLTWSSLRHLQNCQAAGQIFDCLKCIYRIQVRSLLGLVTIWTHYFTYSLLLMRHDWCDSSCWRRPTNPKLIDIVAFIDVGVDHRLMTADSLTIRVWHFGVDTSLETILGSSLSVDNSFS